MSENSLIIKEDVGFIKKGSHKRRMVPGEFLKNVDGDKKSEMEGGEESRFRFRITAG